MTMNLPLEQLTRRSLSDNVALARAVGWNDVESDWRVLHRAAYVVGAYEQNRLVAQAALGDYGTAGTIAKMIVAPDHQRRGLGRCLLEALLAEAEQRAMSAVGLVATEFGRPLYERYGFEATGDVVVLRGRPKRADADSRGAPLTSAASAAQIDRRFMRCSRERMVVARFQESFIAICSTEADGYALATAQGKHALVGPVIASTEEVARELTSSLFRSIDQPVRIDVPERQRTFRHWLRDRGLAEETRRSEMARGTTPLPWQVPQRFALAAQAWG